MAKLIPGRIRNQGIALYEAGVISIISQKGTLLQASVDGIAIQYSLNDEEVVCQCAFFREKAYCEHLAAVEHFLKNDTQGRELVEELEEGTDVAEEVTERQSFGSLFLDTLQMNDNTETAFSLGAEGQQSPYSNDIWWTLRIRRLPDQRSYVIRDIKSFLNIVKKESFYQIGKNYYEPLSFGQFDDASQQLIEFLWRLTPDTSQQDLAFLFPNHNRHLLVPSGFFEEGLLLLNQLDYFSLEVGLKTYHSIDVTYLQPEHHLFEFEVEVHQKVIELKVKEKSHQAYFDHQYLFVSGHFYYLDRKQQKLVSALKTLPIAEDLVKHLHFDLDDQDKLAASLLDFELIGKVKAPKTFQQRDFKVLFAFDWHDDNRLALQTTLQFKETEVTTRAQLKDLPFAVHYKKEADLFQLIETEGFGFDLRGEKLLLSSHDLVPFFQISLPQFRQLGAINLSDRLEAMRVVERPKVRVERKGGLLDVSFDFTQLGEEDVDRALQALFDNQTYFMAQSGKMVVFDQETQKISQALEKLRAKTFQNGHVQLNSTAAFQLSETFTNSEQVSFSQDFQNLARDLRHPEAFELPELSVKADLRDYQLRGIQWLSMLDHYGFGGILADDMGLGKTLQTIAFLTSRLSKDAHSLILAPSSLIYNWQEEFNKFAPQIDVAVSYGLKSVRDQIIANNHQVTITSYSSFRQDFKEYQGRAYDYLILDEAQVMKNAQTKIAHYLRQFDVKNVFALSGTPIENKLLEIWSIFQIVLPGLLPNQKAFLKLDANQVSRYIKPFVLRRKKEDVLPELPDLIEITYPNELAESQKAIYLAQLRQMQERINQSSDSEINRQKIEILSGITRLRQICDTPSLFMDYAGNSGKLDSLRDLLLQIKENGHRALIFSQFRGMLDIAEAELDKLGLSTYKITGSTPANQRQEMTRAFNAGSKDAFLISLKAGGVGLNLTGADTVVLIDLWWNPAVEMQAISRAHRIGQQENVEVYRLITRGTIEEKILEMQDNKRNLVTTVLDGNETRANMTIEDIKEILGIGVDR
ncbi:DEAD/DEAH box helicase [Streptococcus halotolerans]|uniref:DEAD/DEAH box helicase n=1 Tax=Streptococcus halotolerans TaxID=1814128 RepID=UPI00078807DA|nr:DEAD/DEAH box helicase [Streptococcus halotolerans]